MRLLIDPESIQRARVWRAYVRREAESDTWTLGPEFVGFAKDAFLTGLLSRNVETEDALRAELARPDVPPGGADVDLDFMPASPDDNRPALIVRDTTHLLGLFALPPERTSALYHAAMRVGFCMLDPSRHFPIDQHPGLYSPPVGTARTP